VPYVVVDRDAAQWRKRLANLHQEYFGPEVSDPLEGERRAERFWSAAANEVRRRFGFCSCQH
jgi:hypothetical protein